MIEMKPFTEADWSAWAGCEGTDPKIGVIKVASLNWSKSADESGSVDAVVIADASCVQIYFPDEDGEIERWMALSVRSQKLADVIAGSLHDGITQLELINDYGFVWQNL